MKDSHHIANNYRLAKAILTSHAVFNYLTSLQNQITFDQKRDALNGLSAYARFSRQILQTAEMDLISCEKEGELLQTYLNMEKMRFADSFDAALGITDNPHGNIPVFVALPLIELIIAISPKPISLQIDLNPKELRVTVNSKNQSFQTCKLNTEQETRYRFFIEQLKINHLELKLHHPKPNQSLYQIEL